MIEGLSGMTNLPGSKLKQCDKPVAEARAWKPRVTFQRIRIQEILGVEWLGDGAAIGIQHVFSRVVMAIMGRPHTVTLLRR